MKAAHLIAQSLFCVFVMNSSNHYEEVLSFCSAQCLCMVMDAARKKNCPSLSFLLDQLMNLLHQQVNSMGVVWASLL